MSFLPVYKRALRSAGSNFFSLPVLFELPWVIYKSFNDRLSCLQGASSTLHQNMFPFTIVPSSCPFHSLHPALHSNTYMLSSVDQISRCFPWPLSTPLLYLSLFNLNHLLSIALFLTDSTPQATLSFMLVANCIVLSFSVRKQATLLTTGKELWISMKRKEKIEGLCYCRRIVGWSPTQSGWGTEASLTRGFASSRTF